MTTLDLDVTSRARAKEQLDEALKSLRGFGAVKKVLVETAGTVLDTTVGSTGSPVKTIGKYLVSRILDSLPERFILGPPYLWYGHQDLGLTNDPSDVLVDLNCWARNNKDEAKAEDDRWRVNDLLWAAFLADLRTDFDHGWRAGERSLNCVVLLDNADTVLGRCFLEELARIRRQRVAGGQDDADPLTVVVTSRGELLEGVPDADWASVPSEGADAGKLPRAPDGSLPWLLQYRLPDLTEAGVGAAVNALGLDRGNNQRLSRVVFQLMAPEHYQDFRRFFTEFKFNPTHLADDRVMTMHDAVLAAAKAVRLAAPGAARPGAPTAAEVRDQLMNLHGLNVVPGASGTLSFSYREPGAGNPRGKPLLVVQFPSATPGVFQQVGPTYFTP